MLCPLHSRYPAPPRPAGVPPYLVAVAPLGLIGCMYASDGRPELPITLIMAAWIVIQPICLTMPTGRPLRHAFGLSSAALRRLFPVYLLASLVLAALTLAGLFLGATLIDPSVRPESPWQLPIVRQLTLLLVLSHTASTLHHLWRATHPRPWTPPTTTSLFSSSSSSSIPSSSSTTSSSSRSSLSDATPARTIAANLGASLSPLAYATISLAGLFIGVTVTFFLWDPSTRSAAGSSIIGGIIGLLSVSLLGLAIVRAQLTDRWAALGLTRSAIARGLGHLDIRVSGALLAASAIGVVSSHIVATLRGAPAFSDHAPIVLAAAGALKPEDLATLFPLADTAAHSPTYGAILITTRFIVDVLYIWTFSTLLYFFGIFLTVIFGRIDALRTSTGVVVALEILMFIVCGAFTGILVAAMGKASLAVIGTLTWSPDQFGFLPLAVLAAVWVVAAFVTRWSNHIQSRLPVGPKRLLIYRMVHNQGTGA